MFYLRTGFPATRAHLTESNFSEEPSTRCSFTVIIYNITDLDPRSPISGMNSLISSDITIP